MRFAQRGREDACGLPPAWEPARGLREQGDHEVTPRRDQARSALGRRIEEAVPIDTVAQLVE